MRNLIENAKEKLTKTKEWFLKSPAATKLTSIEGDAGTNWLISIVIGVAVAAILIGILKTAAPDLINTVMERLKGFVAG